MLATCCGRASPDLKIEASRHEAFCRHLEACRRGFAPAGTPTAPEPANTTDGFAGDEEAKPPQHSAKSACNYGRHRWLGLVVRDAELPGAAHRVAVVLWQLQNDQRQCAWPSLAYLAAELRMHKSTVIRSLRALLRRQWITKAQRGGRHRTNEYRISFGSVGDEDEDVAP
jgi:hypothetical protein